MDGILNINKPRGMTSFDVVSEIRRLSETRKVGHAGTLDPDACGVLPVCIGKATKVIEYLMDKDKAYRVEMVLGAATDTQDASGNILYDKTVENTFEQIEKAIKSFVGEREQIPPMYSAVRVNGKRLYELARKGIEIERKPRTVKFYRIDISGMIRRGPKVVAVLDVECSRGTYIRTLCHDIGESLGCGGHMASLLRTRSGPFALENSVTLDELEQLKAAGDLCRAIIDMDQAILNMPACHVSREDARRLKNGLQIRIEGLPPGLTRVYLHDGCFVSIGKTVGTGSALMLKSHKWVGNDASGL